MPIDSAASTGNLLLDALSGSDRALIAPHLEPVTFAKGDTALSAGVAASHVIFPHVQTVVALIVATLNATLFGCRLSGVTWFPRGRESGTR